VTSVASTGAYTAGAMTAFAANSVLCRMALAPGSIDPASFTSLRMLSGAVTLWLLARLIGGRSAAGGGSWESAGYLFLYAITFSFAYLSLSAGTGALLLFGSVQITMIVWALRSGERPRPGRWIGMAVAVTGFVYLVLPGVTAPSPLGAALMTTAGIAWGFYSLRRTPGSDPLAETTGNFLRAVPMAALVSLLFISQADADFDGMLLAVLSGAVASGIGYVVWFAALRGLTASTAAIVQISVAPIAALGGVLFLGETIGARLATAAVLILGGIALALVSRSAPQA
jgi:drug/metabolite transporter (DMT)-like permease